MIFGSTFRPCLRLLALTAMLAQPGAVFSQISSDAQKTQTEAVTRWLQRSAWPLKSRTVGSGFEDLQPLKETLKDVRIVGLGEATHGTREFFQFKHRMVEFLVRELGFTVFALEVQYFKCLPLNEYVLHGSASDDPVKLVKANLSGIYQTEEVLALVQWMREYNQTVPPERRVRFQGFDVQTPHRAAAAVMAYLKRVAPAYVPTAQKVINQTAPREWQKFWLAYSQRPALQKSRLRAQLLQLIGYLAAQQARFVRLTSDAEFETALQAARILVQSDEIRNTPAAQQQGVGDKRDQHMAETVEYLLQRERPDTKLILWAHNFHLWMLQPSSGSNLHTAMRAALKHNQLLFKPLGSYLREVFGPRYYAFGLVFDQGSFQAVAVEDGLESMEPKEFTLGPAPVGSGGWQMSQAGLGDFVVDLRAESNDPTVTEWLGTPQLFRYAGADFSARWPEKEYTLPLVMRGHFDGLIFIQKTTRARSL